MTWKKPIVFVPFVLLVLFLIWEIGSRRSSVERGPLEVVQSDTMLDGSVVMGALHLKGSGRYGTILEINRKGEEVWKYVLPESVNPEGTGLLDVQPTEAGTILYSVRGSGFYEINRAGEILWSLADPRASHDVDVLPNGNLLVTYTWAVQGEALAAEIQRDGTPVWEFDGQGVFTGTKYAGFTDEIGAWAHVNSIERLDNGRTVITVRNFNAMVEVNEMGEVVDVFRMDARKTKHSLASQGRLRGGRPHGLTRKPNDRQLTVITRGPNRAVTYDLDQRKIVRAWWGHNVPPDLRKVRSVLPLPNGHWLMTAPATVFEVDANDQLVWVYTPALSDDREQGAQPFFKVAFRSAEGTLYGD